MVVLLFGRLLSLYEAVYIVACRGMSAELAVLLRSMTECHLKLAACAKNEANAEKILLSSEHERKRLLESAAKYRAHIDSREEMGRTQKLIQTIASEISERSIPKLTTKKIAEMADQMWVYELTYSALCQPTHADSRDLQKSFKLKNTGEIEGILWGPNHDGTIFNLTTAMNFLLQGLINPAVPMLDAQSEKVSLWHAKIQMHMLANRRQEISAG